MNWDAFGAIGSWVCGVATLLAVLVSLWQTKFENRKKLKLSCGIDSSGDLGFVIKAVNVGKRPITIDTWGIERKNNSNFFFEELFEESPEYAKNSAMLPCELKLENAIVIRFKLNFIKHYVGIHRAAIGDGYLTFFVTDSTGKKYKARSQYTVESLLKL